MKANNGRLLSVFPVALAVLVASGCGSDETAPTEDHTPATYNILFNEIQATSPYQFTVGQTVRVRVKLFNAAGEDLDNVEAEHFAGLTFNPPAMVSVTRVPGHNFQFDVTGANAASGSLVVSYGHDEQADEKSFPSAPATVEGTGGPN